MKKRIFASILIALFAGIICNPIPVHFASANLSNPIDVEVTRVSAIPKDFINFKDAMEFADGVLDCVMWETQISFLANTTAFSDSCIYQTFISDASLIVDYYDRYYISAHKFAVLYAEALKDDDARRINFRCIDMLKKFKKIKNYRDVAFEDVSKNDWFFKNIKKAYETDLMNGTGENQFSPHEYITVHETIALACRIHSISTEKNYKFKDTKPWYGAYVDYAIKNNIAADPGNSGNNNATREYFVTTINNALPEDATTTRNYVDINYIPDITEDAPYADAVLRFYRAGILTGNGETNAFSPDTPIKRCEVAAVISRIVDWELRK